MSINLPTILSLLFLAAHNLRLGSYGGALFWLTAGALALTPLPWKHWALAGLLAFGGWLWGDIALNFVNGRIAGGLPWLRLAIILGLVGLMTVSAAVANVHRACRLYRADSLAQGLAFLLTVAGLALARERSSLEILLLDRFFPSGGWLIVFFLGWYGAWIVGKMLIPEDSGKWRRRVWAIFSAVFFLQLLLGLFGFDRFLMTGQLHLPVPALIAAGPLYRGDGFFMLILFAVTLLIVGPAWCSHLCYIGAWDNWAATRKKNPSGLPGWTGTARWLICLAVLGMAVLLGRKGSSPTSALVIAAIFGLVGVFVMLLWSRRSGTMSHCTVYCPMGLLADIFGKINPWRIRIQPECSKCGGCSRFCRYGALDAGAIDKQQAGFRCTLCGDCIAACPQGHLYYSFPGVGGKAARSAFIVVIVVLHAIFLGVARL
jgi:ferredoxin